MNPWSAPWQTNYYQQPNPHVYVPPQAYNRPAGYWDQGGWTRPFDANPPGAHPVIPPVVPLPNLKRSSLAAGYRSAKYPNLNPILAADTSLLRFDVAKKPRTDINATTWHGNRYAPAFATPTTHMRVISKAFPWTIDIKVPTGVTCESVWDALYAALQQPLADSEWGLICGNKKQREVLEKAAKKRREIDSEKKLKRIDFMGDATLFKGLERDEDFEKLRLLSGEEAVPDTWVVKFGS